MKNGNGFEVPTGAKVGTSTDNYAIEMNKSATVPTDTFVRLRPRGIADTSLLSGSGCVVNLWEFIYDSSGGSGAVSSVQCVGNILYVTYG
jgi:hypothetical protein